MSDTPENTTAPVVTAATPAARTDEIHNALAAVNPADDTIDDTPLSEAAPAADAQPEPQAEAASSEDVTVKPHNAILSQPVFAAVEKFHPNLETVSLPSDFNKVVAARAGAGPNINIADTAENRVWAQTIAEGSELTSYEDVFVDTLENPEAEFVQEVGTSAGNLRASHPTMVSKDGEALRGDRAVQRLNTFMGLGSIFRFPLYNSGIWITVKPPGEAELLELNRLNISDKILFGRQTYGLAYSNMSAIIADRLVSFVLDNIYTTSVKDDVDLRTIISAQDLQVLIWGIANAIYPNGFQYRRACTCDPLKCQHVVEERLNLSKICWTNQRALSQLQLAHMANNRPKAMDLKAIEAYKREMLTAQKRSIELQGQTGVKLEMVLRVPTIAEYVEAGHRWIGDITTTVNKALGSEASDTERNNFIVRNGQASAMRQYIHWVESVTFGGQTVDHTETNEKLFTVLSQDDVLRDAFMEKVGKYINDTQISVVGIPTYDCPKCNGEQKPPVALPHVTNVIPLDPYQTFFTLLVQRLERIDQR